ncbi:MAG: hypothetical protein GX466_08865 [Candidatus Cloacimonetes bacterium]|nr:hypothetical protein [Candidatus Cloacimonadota bacterium]
MPTIDGGFRTGDKVTPEDFNTSAPQGVVCTVVVEDGRHTMKVEFPDGRQEWVHPYRWKRAPVVAAPPAITEGERSLYRWQYRQTSGFEAPLWQCISTADSANLDALAKGFPEHVTAYRRYASEGGYWNNLRNLIEGE